MPPRPDEDLRPLIQLVCAASSRGIARVSGGSFPLAHCSINHDFSSFAVYRLPSPVPGVQIVGKNAEKARKKGREMDGERPPSPQSPRVFRSPSPVRAFPLI